MSSFLQLQVSVWHSFHLNTHTQTQGMWHFLHVVWRCQHVYLEQQSVEQSENHFLFLWLTALLLPTQLPLFTHWPARSISSSLEPGRRSQATPKSYLHSGKVKNSLCIRPVIQFCSKIYWVLAPFTNFHENRASSFLLFVVGFLINSWWS